MTSLPESTTLSGIDADGLARLSATARADPRSGRKTVRSRTVCEGGFRNLTFVRDLVPVLVAEPPGLLGDDSAPNPSETALAALGSCISVGLLANATHLGTTLSRIEVRLEGEIDISAVWGVGDTPDTKVAGFSEVRAEVVLAGDGDAAMMRRIHDNTMRWSPVLNTFTRPVAFSSELTVE